MKGNITLTILIILGIVFALGVGVAVRYYIQEKPTKELPLESGPQVLQEKKDPAKTEVENKVVTQQLEDPIKNWESYSNAKYNYRIKYPPDWIIQEVNPNLVWLLNNENQKNYAGLTGQAPIVIEVYSSKSYKSIEEFMTTYNFTLPSLKFSDSGDKASSDRYTIVLRNEIIYTISGKSPSVPLNELTSELFEKIYSTFEFIGANQVTSEERDKERVEAFDGFKQAVSFYVNITNNPVLCSDKSRVYSSNSGSNAIDGTGWLPIDWVKTPGGSLYSKLPIDPLNTGEFVYKYRCAPSVMTYEFNVKMESSGGQDLAKIDGGNNPSLYEIGTDLNLLP